MDGFAVAAGLCLLVAGCADAPSLSAAVPKAHHDILLLDTETTLEPSPHLPNRPKPEWTLAAVPVPSGLRNVTFEFTRTSDLGINWDSECRLERDGALLGRADFERVVSASDTVEQTCRLVFGDLAADTYDAIYSGDGVEPTGPVILHLHVEATLRPWLG